MPDGRTALQHVLAFARRCPAEGEAALRDVLPEPVPPVAALAVEVFEVLSSTRGVSVSGPRAITLGDIQAYRDVMGGDVTPRDAAWVLAMDRAYLAAVAEQLQPAEAS